jgi:hypothetical protein
MNGTMDDNWIYTGLCKWSDPHLPAETPPLVGLSERMFQRFLTIARLHGVLAFTLQNTAALASSFPAPCELAQRCVRAEFVRTAFIRRHGEMALDILRNAGIPAVIVKGVDFADQLYPSPRLRPTRDLDILVPRDSWANAAAALQAAGHIRIGRQPDLENPAHTLGEGYWQFPSGSKVTIDLHWNMLNSPRWRRTASVEFGDVVSDLAADNRPSGGLSSASRLILAAVHAVCHHQFDRMLLLRDVQQAARAIRRPADHLRIGEIVQRTNVGIVLDFALAVVAQFFHDALVADLHQQLVRQLRLRSGRFPFPEALLNDARQSLFAINRSQHSLCRRRIRQWMECALLSDSGAT